MVMMTLVSVIVAHDDCEAHYLQEMPSVTKPAGNQSICHLHTKNKLTLSHWSLSPGICGPPVKNCAPAPFAAASPEDGPLLAAQHGGAHPAHVHVRLAGPLDGLHLVHHRQDGDGGQCLQLGHW